MLKIKTDSRLVRSKDTFVAIKGNTVDGHDFIEDAIRMGASKIVCEKGEYKVETLVVKDTKEYLNIYLKENYSHLFSDTKFIGITGTNGKTTTAYLTSQLLTYLGVPNSYIGTIGYFINGEKEGTLSNTTPDILTLYNLIIDSINKGSKAIVMEVSSHALEENRINGINFDVAAFTNLTEDHLDFHKTMEDYLNSKLKILNHLKENSKMIVNADDVNSKFFSKGETYKVGIHGDYKILDYKFNNINSDIKFEYDNNIYELKTNLLGEINVYNSLMSLAIINKLGIPIEKIIKISDKVYAPMGRNQIIDINGAKAVIDYAHTPDAVSKIIDTAREYTKGKIYVVIGCGGNRDKTKRPIMGNIASEKGDFVIFTDDNPRCEKEEDIINDILKGVNKNNYEVIVNRSEAIHKGLSLLEEGDTLLILGKGHENYQIFGTKKSYFSDLDEVNSFKNNYKLIKQI